MDIKRIEKIKEIFCQIKNDNRGISEATKTISEVSENSLVELDSLEMIEFILRVAEEFNVDIDFDKFDHSYMESFSSFSEFIELQV